jgi:hypothetical protein
VAWKSGIEHDVALQYFAACQRYRLADDLIYVQSLAMKRLLLDQRANALDHITDAEAVSDDIVQRLASLTQIGLLRVHQPARCAGVCNQCTNGLVDLMRDRGHQLTDGCDTIGVGEFVLGVKSRLFGLLAFGHIDMGTDDLNDLAGRAKNGMCNAMKIFYRTIGVNNAVRCVRVPLDRETICSRRAPLGGTVVVPIFRRSYGNGGVGFASDPLGISKSHDINDCPVGERAREVP